jgi:hypothetical protein
MLQANIDSGKLTLKHGSGFIFLLSCVLQPMDQGAVATWKAYYWFYLPSIMMCVLQPMDQGAIATWKAYYWRCTFTETFAVTEEENTLRNLWK